MNTCMLTPTETAALRALLAHESAQLGIRAAIPDWSGPAFIQVSR